MYLPVIQDADNMYSAKSVYPSSWFTDWLLTSKLCARECTPPRDWLLTSKLCANSRFTRLDKMIGLIGRISHHCMNQHAFLIWHSQYPHIQIRKISFFETRTVSYKRILNRLLRQVKSSSLSLKVSIRGAISLGGGETRNSNDSGFKPSFRTSVFNVSRTKYKH